nr:LysM peptidoglycan-binding domain-containing protein [Yoonia ponticola]
MLGGDVVETVVAGADGAFGVVVAITASDQPRRVQLVADPDGAALASAESIIVPPKEIAFVAEVVADDPVAVPAAAEDLTPPAAPPTLIADADGVRILQVETQSPAQPDLTENIGLDTITYDPSGEVQLAGRGAAAGGFVRIYLDNEPITESRISGEGDWRSDLPQVDTGLYTLRLDEVDADGVVQSRVETPFKKEEPEEVAAILAEETAAEGFDIAVKTVQPGATLWAIAEEQLGSGVLYVSVFEANRDLIRDPDLIYPGQVFRIPDPAQ